MSHRAFAWLLLPAALGAASFVPWEDLAEGDWIYALATRYATVDGHRVHYPTPTAELARSLEGRTDPAAQRHLAEARLALGDRPGAIAALERWAQAEGPGAWAEAARWEAAHQDYAAALRSAERALPGLEPEARRALADERIGWAELHPDLADPVALLRARSDLFPGDGAALERWIRALERAGRIPEADRALAGAQALTPERRLLTRSDLLADHGDPAGAYRLLDAAVAEPWSLAFRRAYAARVDQAAPLAPGTWRATLEKTFDAGALTRLCTYFQGRGDGAGSAAELLRQVQRRFEPRLARPELLLLTRLFGELDEAPDAFRTALAAAQLGATEADRRADLAALARLALAAGGRPLAWGTYNDEAYRWTAAIDRTPGFWTGGIAFLLTGVEWKETLDRVENAALPDRTFATARALAAALARTAPADPALAALRVAIMARHVERGEGAAALALLPAVEPAAPALADEARRVALLAAQQAPLPLAEEVRLLKARLGYAAPDGSRPSARQDAPWEPRPGDPRPWARVEAPDAPDYTGLLNAGLARLDLLDPSHRAALGLILGELDRLPDDQALWLDLAARLERWNLDDELGPRYLKALDRFQDPGIWAKAARWQARRNYQAELRRLAADVAARFRGTALFQRGADEVPVEVPDQPRVGTRVRLVRWADLVRLRALERFPHSPEVFREAQALVTASDWSRHFDPAREARKPFTRVVVPDQLMEQRRWALLFADPGQREAWFAERMRRGDLEPRLAALEARADRTPVEDLLLFEGWARLSRFEQAVPAADRIASAYPGDGPLARRVLSLHRSLNGLENAHLAPARALVERTAPALEDAGPLWTELGEMEEERGRPDAAIAQWRAILARDPRDPAKVAELATLLWDYNHDREALAVLEAGRKAMARPRFLAFEAGVLRENLRDLDGAVREYLDAVAPGEGDVQAGSEGDQRALRRLAQLLASEPVFRRVAARIQALAPGDPADERTLAAFFTLAGIEPPDPGLSWDADQWIDDLDLPSDAQGRAQRQARREAGRPAEFTAIRRIGDLLLDKARAMVPRASGPEFLAFSEGTVKALAQERWPGDQVVSLADRILARRAELAPGEEERIRLEMDRARFLAGAGRIQAADELWAALDLRIDRLPEGSVRLRAEAERAGYLERAKGLPAAAQEWRRITARHPWSLGLLDDRLAFLDRAGLGEEARTLLEQTVPRAASGHRERLLDQLTQASLAAGDLTRARRAVDQLLAQPDLEPARRLQAVHLLARLAFRSDPGWDALAYAKAQAAAFPPDLIADLHQELARAADLEHARSTGLWIEALNRRTERAWLAAAARSAQKAGTGPELLGFFQQQRERSPRDVRWAVAVRDLRRQFHDVDGAVEAAKAAVTARPELEDLWQEAADILVAADRVHEAADYLDGWNRTRPADAKVAARRSELYCQAGDGPRALAVERAALDAYAREAGATPEERATRRGRAVQRLYAGGFPGLALKLCSPAGDAAALKGCDLPDPVRVQLALLAGQLPRLLGGYAGDPEFQGAAGAVLVAQGRPEQKEAVQAWLERTLFPAKAARPDSRALARWWPFIAASGLEPGLRAALAGRYLAARPGPWQPAAPFAFVEAVGAQLITGTEAGPDADPAEGDAPARQAFREPDLDRLWVQDLVRRRRPAELLALLEPHWNQLLAQVRGNAPLGPGSERLAWTAWLDDPAALRAWLGAAAAQPERLQELAGIMADRRLWDRFWVLGARHWAVEPLVAVLPGAARTAWFGFWEPAAGNDPVLQARRRGVEQVAGLMGRLLQGAPDAAADPLLERLRGPRTVGAILGRDGRWTWPEFAPRKDARGAPAETGDDRITGQGVDQGREPGALWGDRPGEAWYVLEGLSRYRQGDPSAPWLPLESLQKGAETQRALLAIRLARGLGDLDLALRIAQASPGPARDRSWLEGRLALLTAAGRGPEAAAAFTAFVRDLQPGLTEADLRWLADLARRLGLPAPLASLDPERPVGPVLLAILEDQDPAAAQKLRTGDPVNYRTALLRRWEAREDRLSRAQVRTWLKELWATGSAPLPARGLARLGKVWAQAGEWLGQVAAPERPEALAALDQALDRTVAQPRLLPRLAQGDPGDGVRLLAVRIRLARGELEPALALLDAMLAAPEAGPGAGAAGPAAAGPAEAEPAEGPETAPEGAGEGLRDPLAARLEAWLRPFREANQAQPAGDRIRKLLAQRRGAGAVSAEAWRLAFQLAPGDRALAQELDAAWFRGEVPAQDLGRILEAAAGALDLRPWLARWPRTGAFAEARLRSAILARRKQPAEAARALLEARDASLWTAREEVLAFDLWQRLGPAPQVPAPAYWAGALEAARDGLEARLRAHPHDVLAARKAVASLAPADPDTMVRAALVLRQDRPWFQERMEADLAILELRGARACGCAAQGWDLERFLPMLAERPFKPADIDAALADLARLAAAAGDEPQARKLLAALRERGADGLPALQAELEKAFTGRAWPYRVADGKPVPVRPRDLTWAMLADVLTKEGVR